MKRLTLSTLFLAAFSLTALAQTAPAVDNTKTNERDRNNQTKTSGSQSNNADDVKLTAAIRRAVVGDHSLSMMAKNVKIITADGAVTLRGPVKNDAEKTKIGQLAASAASGVHIDNQLEVKASK